jgi:hypothetical protein
MLQSNRWRREEAALLYALRIYTRDLRIPITLGRISPKAEREGTPLMGARVQCASGATLVVWFSGELSAPELSILRCAEEEEEEEAYLLPMQPVKNLDLAAQTLALKIRGLLTDATPVDGDNASPSLVAENLAQPGPEGLSPAVESESANEEKIGDGQSAATAAAAGREKEVRGPAAVGQRKPAVEGGMEWAFGAANSFSGLHQGLLLRFALVSAQLPLALELDGAFVTSVASDVARYHLTMSEIPIGVALSARLNRASWTFSGGPRVSLNRVQADGVGPDGRSGSETSFAAGVGAMEQVIYRASETVGFALSLSNEAIFPRRKFTLDGRNGLDVGRFQWTLSAGVVVRP